MKLQIDYKKNTDVDAPCVAGTEVRGEYICALGRTWGEAKERLMAKLEGYLNANVPPPEAIEVKVADEDMATELLPWENQFDGVVGRIIEPGKV